MAPSCAFSAKEISAPTSSSYSSEVWRSNERKHVVSRHRERNARAEPHAYSTDRRGKFAVKLPSRRRMHERFDAAARGDASIMGGGPNDHEFARRSE